MLARQKERMKKVTALSLVALAIAAVACGGLAHQHKLPSWEVLRDDYADSGKGPSVTETPKESPDAYALHLAFPSTDGSTVQGLFMRPRADGVYPLILLMHGLGGNKDYFAAQLAKPFLEKGVAVFALDVPYHGERRTRETDGMLLSMLFQTQKSGVKGDLVEQVSSVDKDHKYAKLFVTMVHEGVLDYRQGLDYLGTRKDIDHRHIGLLGYSLGSIMGSILASVDDRISFATLCVGGDPILPMVDTMPEELKGQAAEISPSLFIEHIATRPILMLNGTNDQVISGAATKRLFKAAGQPKEIKWFDSGHILPPQALSEAVDWSMSHLRS